MNGEDPKTVGERFMKTIQDEKVPYQATNFINLLYKIIFVIN